MTVRRTLFLLALAVPCFAQSRDSLLAEKVQINTQLAVERPRRDSLTTVVTAMNRATAVVRVKRDSIAELVSAYNARIRAINVLLATPAPAPVPSPPVPSAYAAPDIFLATHEDGTLRAYDGGFTPGEVSNVANPAGAGRAMRITYGTGPSHPDENHYAVATIPVGPNGMGFGRSLFTAFRIYFPVGTIGLTNGAIQRKIYYVRDDNAPLGLITKLWGDGIYVGFFDGVQVPFPDKFARKLNPAGSWTHVETEWHFNSSPAASDGYVKVWVDGVLALTWSGLKIAAVANAFSHSYATQIGDQRESGAGDINGTEERLLDNVAFSRTRIGPS